MSVLPMEEIRRIVSTRQSDCDGCTPSVMVWTTNGGAVTAFTVNHARACTITPNGTWGSSVPTRELEVAA